MKGGEMLNEMRVIRESLEKQRKYLTKQLTKVENALDALKGNRPRHYSIIKWTKEIMNLFRKHEVLTIKKLREELIASGINEAATKERLLTINATIMRQVKAGKLEKEAKGVYRLKNNKYNRKETK